MASDAPLRSVKGSDVCSKCSVKLGGVGSKRALLRFLISWRPGDESRVGIIKSQVVQQGWGMHAYCRGSDFGLHGWERTEAALVLEPCITSAN